MTIDQFEKELSEFNVAISKSDLYFYAYKGFLEIQWDEHGEYANVYLGDHILHDGCDIAQCKRYLTIIQEES